MTEYLPKFDFNIEAIFKMNDINKRTQSHLTKVYAALGSGVVFSLFCGIMAANRLIPVGLVIILAVSAFIAEIFTFFMSRKNKFANTYLKPGTFYSYALCFGSIIGYLFLDADRSERKFLASIVSTAFIYTMAIFSTFSVFALFTVRRTQIFFGAVVMSLILGLINIFVYSALPESLIGLILGVLYVIIDTQMIIYKAENGLFDIFTDAKELLIDMFKIFIEITKLLAKKKKDD